MLISELIEGLKETQKTFGDLPVIFAKSDLDMLSDAFDNGEDYTLAEPVGNVTISMGGENEDGTATGEVYCVLQDIQIGNRHLGYKFGKIIPVEGEDE